MRERPILFSSPMVRAILSGRKTQTRRVVKGQALDWLNDGFTPGFVADYQNRLCPYGQPGDRLWVREAFGIGYDDGNGGLSAIPWTGSDPQRDGTVVYRADFNEEPDEPRRPWKPSIHMPRWASRILLEVTGVRVERLQDISEEDAAAEGIHFDRTVPFNGPWFIEPSDPQGYLLASSCYEALWDQINGPGSWDANPWVWGVEFKRLEGGAA